MKKLTVLARKEDQETLLQAFQSFKNVEIINLKDKLTDELLDEFEVNTYESELRDLSQKLDKIDEAIAYLVPYAKEKSLWQKLSQAKEVYSLKELDHEVQQLDIDLLLKVVQDQKDKIDCLEKEIEDIENSEQFLRQWQKLEVSPKDFEKLKVLEVFVGSIETKLAEDFVDEIEKHQAIADEIYYSDEFMNFMITTTKTNKDTIQAVLDRFAFKKLTYPHVHNPKEALKRNLTYRDKLVRLHLDYRQKLRFNDETLRKLRLVKEYVYNLREREKARELIVNSASLFMISGWTPEEVVDQEIVALREIFQDKPLAVFTEDLSMEEVDDVPIKLDNAHIIGPFESLTEQYSLPKYGQIDPTPYLYPFHILFFGMMSADFGYGLVLFLLTLIPLKTFDLSDGQRNTLRFFHQLSYGTMAVGLFFGSFFGFNLPFKVWDITDNVIEVLVLSVVFGIIHLFVGYLLKSITTFKDRDWKSFYLDAVQWMLMLIGIVLLGVNAAFLGNQDIIQKIGVWLILGNVAGMILVNILASKNKLVGLGQGALGVIGVAGFMGDLISYTRLAALAVSGANIGMAFNMIIGILPAFLRFTVGIALFIVLHALNIFLSFLGAYVHDMRLEYVEFFGKFHDGGGRKFSPLSPLEENIRIKKEYE